jgi:hypothetical protein
MVVKIPDPDPAKKGPDPNPRKLAAQVGTDIEKYTSDILHWGV